MADATAIIERVERMLAKHGMTITLKQPNKGTFDAEAGQYTGGSADTETQVAAVKMDYAQKLVDGSMIQRGDVKFIVSPKNITSAPKPGEDTLVAGGIEYQIIPPVRTLDPAGTPLYYEIQARA